MSDRPPLGYRAVSALCRFLLEVFYPRLEVIGAERIPARGPLIVAANHHNSVVDAMILVAVVPRWLRTLANAPLFKHPLIGPFLKAMGGLPVHRRQEAGHDPSRNQSLFAATTAALRSGGSIMLFPEGRTQPEPVLLELRTGAARMLLEAHAGVTMDPPVTLLPVGLVFHDPGTFREGEALVIVGDPVDTRAAIQEAASSPEAAARQLTDDLARAIRGVIVEAGDRETLSLLRLAHEIWRERDAAGSQGSDGLGWMKNALSVYRAADARDPARTARLRENLSTCARDLAKAKLSVSDLFAPPRAHQHAPSLAMLAVATPFAILGIAMHVIPYKLTGRLVARILKDEEEEATDKIAVGFVFFLVAWAVEIGFVAWIVSPVAAAAFGLILIPFGFLALWWLEGWNERSRAGRIRRSEMNGVSKHLRERCRVLAAELQEIAAA